MLPPALLPRPPPPSQPSPPRARPHAPWRRAPAPPRLPRPPQTRGRGARRARRAARQLATAQPPARTPPRARVSGTRGCPPSGVRSPVRVRAEGAGCCAWRCLGPTAKPGLPTASAKSGQAAAFPCPIGAHVLVARPRCALGRQLVPRCPQRRLGCVCNCLRIGRRGAQHVALRGHLTDMGLRCGHALCGLRRIRVPEKPREARAATIRSLGFPTTNQELSW
jgi:hypothetical protein